MDVRSTTGSDRQRLPHWIVAGQGVGELFEVWAADAVESVRRSYALAGGGGTIFDVVTRGIDRQDVVSVFEGDGIPVLDAANPVSVETVEKVRISLLCSAVPVVRLRVVAEAPLVVVSMVSSEIERFQDRYASTAVDRMVRKHRLVGRLSEMTRGYQGGVMHAAEGPADRKPSLLRVHARGLAVFPLVALTRSLQEAAVEVLSSGLQPALSRRRISARAG